MVYIALFLTPDLYVMGTKNFKPTDTFLTYKKGTCNIRLDAFLYKTKDNTYYGYIYPTDEKLLIDIKLEPIKRELPKDLGNGKYEEIKYNSARLVNIKEKIEKGDLHLLVAESIIGQLARAFLQTVKTNWVFILLALGTGIAIGYIACTVTTPHNITAVINATTTIEPAPIG